MMKSLSIAWSFLMLMAISSTADAFAPAQNNAKLSALRMSEPEMNSLTEEESTVVSTPVATAPAISMALPFLAREAEVKHARLAMLAPAGWPSSKVLEKEIASAFDMAPMLDSTDRVPSLLNGGLGKNAFHLMP